MSRTTLFSRKGEIARVLGRITVIAVFLFTIGVYSQTTEAWKRRNDKGNRYEGLISILTGNPDLEVLALTGFFEPFKGKVNLKIKFFLPVSANPSITAHEIEEQRQYWMEVKPKKWQTGSWNEVNPWPTGDVITREAIPWDNIAVLIRLNDSDQLIPAFVYNRRTPNRVQKYTLYLRSNRDLKIVRFTLSGDNSGSKPKSSSLVLGKQSANVPFAAHLDLSGFNDGWIRVMIERELRDSPQKLPVREYAFYHHKQVY